MSDLIHTKSTLWAFCRRHLNERIAGLESALAAVEESRNNETKSSVGDKYETGRAMMQQEAEKYRTQLANAIYLSRQLDQVDPGRICDKVEVGSLVITNGGKYFISVGLGKIKLEEGLYYAISVEAPISQAMLGKQKGDQLHFNQRLIEILDIS